MAEYLVPVNEGKEKVRVRLSTPPKDQAALEAAIDAELANGRYESMTPDIYRGRGGSMIRGAAQAAPSVAGGILGAAGGAMLGGPPGALAGNVAGSMAGEAVTQYVDPFSTGIEEPSLTSIGVAGAVPLGVAGAGKAIGSVLKGAPGVQAGLQDVAQRALGSGAQNVMRAVPASRPLWQRVDQSSRGILVGTARLKLIANEMDQALKADKFATPQTKRLVARLRELSKGEGDTAAYVPLQEFRQNMTSLGAELRQHKGAARGIAKKAYKAMWEELDDAVKGAEQAGNPTGTLLRSAVEATKREQARDTLARWYQQSVSYSTGQRQVNLDSLLTKFERNEDLLKRWLPMDELQEMKDILRDYAGKTPRIPGSTEPVGNASRVFSAIGPDQLANMLSSRPGRAAVRTMVEQASKIQYGLLTPAVQAGSRALLSPPEPQVGDSPVFRKNLRDQLPPAPPSGGLTGGTGAGILSGIPGFGQ